MHSRLVILALGLSACSAAAPDPVSDTGGTDAASGTETDATSESGDASTDTDSSTTTSTTDDGGTDECQSDGDCPGTQVCDMPSLYPSSCVPCGECCSKVDCLQGYVCQPGSHHNSNGQCELECQPVDGPCGDDGDCCEGLVCVGEGPAASCQLA